MTAETSNARGEWLLVPREPTEAMISHGEEWEYSTISNGPAMARQLYAAMLAAAPPPAAIAALSAQQSPAEAQPVATLVNRKDADGGKTTTFIRPTGLGLDLPIGEYPLHLHPPPSAPVGVERIAAEIRASLGHGATVSTRRRWAIELEALAQQPAAVDRAEIDLEAIAWAYRKLLAFGCYSSEQGAMMGDRLNLMLLAAQQQEVAK